ncbi:MAG: PIN domain-containing protein [Gemmataceae bacterium]|nr:PIN domain-containing protein [Gemmataceae bacterium]
MLVWILRGCFGAIIIGMAWAAFNYFSAQRPPDVAHGIQAFIVILGIGVLVLLTDVLVRNKQITTISAVYFGLLLGLLLGTLFSAALEPMVTDWLTPFSDLRKEEVGRAVRLLVTVVCCYVSISTLLQTKDEFRFIIPYVEFQKQVKGVRPLVLDTSVIIDGRIADICETGILDTKLVIPRFVLQELQSVADSSDKIKRNRGRRGLDILKRMQGNPKVELQMHEANLPELREVYKVDERLVVLAKAIGARVVTNDFNLNKIAQLQGVEVINLNELANALKLVALPGEHLSVRIVKQGDQFGQGVGYLDDGTMVVVEQGRSHIGQEVAITVTSVLQTPAGRMIFGRIEGRVHAPSGPAQSGER